MCAKPYKNVVPFHLYAFDFPEHRTWSQQCWKHQRPPDSAESWEFLEMGTATRGNVGRRVLPKKFHDLIILYNIIYMTLYSQV